MLNGYGMESGTALTAARVKALQNSNNHAGVSSEQYQQNFGAAVKATASSLNLNSGEYGGYDQNAGIKSVDNGNLSQRAGAAAQNADNTTQNANNIAMPESDFPPTGDPISFEQPEAIRAEENKNAQKIEGSREKEAAARYEQQEEPARQQLEHNSPEYSRMSAAEHYTVASPMLETGQKGERKKQGSTPKTLTSDLTRSKTIRLCVKMQWVAPTRFNKKLRNPMLEMVTRFLYFLDGALRQSPLELIISIDYDR